MALDVNKLLHKLQMIGKEIVEYNSFGIIYKENKELALAKITMHQIDYVKGFEDYVLTNYFIAIRDYSIGDANIYKLYIEKSSIDQVQNLERSLSMYFDRNIARHPTRDKNIKICVYETPVGKLYVINNKGKRINLTERLCDYSEVEDIEIIHSDTKDGTDIYFIYATLILYYDENGDDGSDCEITITIDEQLNIIDITGSP